ncbi:hypothetical protein BDB01DRAFT_853223 [Pilobolus umbonatus]|nr:hypothetical protein BDB01DRAFT_853223 [Pilobolus umbonatus]
MHFLFEAFDRRPMEPRFLIWFRGIIALIMTGAFLAYFAYLIIQIKEEIPLVQEYSGELLEMVRAPDIKICSENGDLQLFCPISPDSPRDYDANCDRFFTEYFDGDCYNYLMNNEFSLASRYNESNATDENTLIPLNAALILFPPGQAVQPDNPEFFDHRQVMTLLSHMDYQVPLDKYEWSDIYFQNEVYHAIRKNDFSAYFGLKPNYLEYISVKSKVATSAEIRSNETMTEFRGMFTLSLYDRSQTIKEEIKQHTILSTLGLAGGGYSVMTIIYIFIFGASRLSPWGLFHLCYSISFKLGKSKENKDLTYSTLNKRETIQRDMTIVENQQEKHTFEGFEDLLSKEKTKSGLQQDKKQDITLEHEELEIGSLRSARSITEPTIQKKKDENRDGDESIYSTQVILNASDLQKRMNEMEKREKEEKSQRAMLSQRVKELECILRTYYIDSSYLDKMSSIDSSPAKHLENW